MQNCDTSNYEIYSIVVTKYKFPRQTSFFWKFKSKYRLFICVEKREDVRKRVNDGIEKQDFPALETAVKDGNELGMQEDATVKKGQQVLDYVTCSERKTTALFYHFKYKVIVVLPQVM